MLPHISAQADAEGARALGSGASKALLLAWLHTLLAPKPRERAARGGRSGAHTARAHELEHFFHGEALGR